jgi:hypothetical protein
VIAHNVDGCDWELKRVALYLMRGWAESISVVAVSGAAINTVTSLIDCGGGSNCCFTAASSDKE